MKLPRRRFLHVTAGAVTLPAVSRFAWAQAYPTRKAPIATALDTFAAPELWSGFSDFYKRATAASKLAFEASRAKGTGDLKTLVAELRTACNACHASYLKTQ